MWIRGRCSCLQVMRANVVKYSYWLQIKTFSFVDDMSTAHAVGRDDVMNVAPKCVLMNGILDL